MLGEPLLQIGPLHVMEASRIATIVAGKSAACRINFETECVTASFGEDFIALRLRMISPDVLPLGMNQDRRTFFVGWLRFAESD